jgi:hypothetical protein
MPPNRDFYKDGLPHYDTIRESLKRAVEETLDKDYDLIALGGHEQAIAHRIAVYLENPFSSFNIDCEYNRNKHKTKNRRPESPSDDRKMRPDIIVHRRNTPENVLAVEMKAHANPATTDDRDKLKCLKCEKTYLYKGIAFVCVRNKVEEMVDGVLRATIDWFCMDGNTLCCEDKNHMDLKCNRHTDEVKTILEQRIGE